MKKQLSLKTLSLFFSLWMGTSAVNGFAQTNKGTAYKVYGKETALEDVIKSDQATFYELEKKKYDRIEAAARQAYVEAFWEKQAKSRGISVDKYRDEYFSKNVKISNKEVADTLDKFKDHPRLSKLPKAEQEQQVRDYLEDRERRELIESVISQGLKSGELVVLYPQPEEPLFHVEITSDDVVRYSTEAEDNKPVGCKGEECPITVVEFSEYQCPFCARVIPDTRQVLNTYKGKVRWIVKDFPLSFHDRARPAAITAKCAAFQGKYWKMYDKLFANQTKLSDSDLAGYAEQVGLDMDKYRNCTKDSAKAEALIDKNFQLGVQVGVSGTPAYFINGRRLSGALPFAEFQRIIEEELAKKGKS